MQQTRSEPRRARSLILHDVNSSAELRFREAGADADELRYASGYAEVDGEREQWGLYAYTLRAGSDVQAVLLTDTPADFDSTLSTWRSLRFTSSSG
ncbi:hypothetical protein [Micromonospora deserti]|uniref:Uncharacterized protein n=1 Tax=Micromonospora deserti TaxID=2070366 RepID=A0A2W2DN87_9ACTN|nr:hypothetical protein [Micromonospora deserti]PZG02350.1 hypothetical protein C1I99_03175 [Micromonospora deserti]